MTSQCQVVELNQNPSIHGVCCKINLSRGKIAYRMNAKFVLYKINVILSHNANFDVMIMTSQCHDVINFC